MTTATSFQRLVTHAALFDELGKIAEAVSPQDKKLKFRKWLKNTALHAAGAGAGTALFMGADKVFGDKMGKPWQAMGPKTKMLAGTLAGLGTTLIGQKLLEAKRKADDKK